MSNDNVAIRVSDLSKCYSIYATPHDRLKQFLLPRAQRYFRLAQRNYFREFWALRDVSFQVNKGEAVGIIGRNGAGKSTLLQLICGTLSPTGGSVEVSGTVAALLELGSGFNPEFTGRENVYLNASVLGLTREETDATFDEIAAFADIGDFLDQPTKTYSSGMLMRLAFAVNTCVNPEILIVDEALGVGDAPFQSKCFKRLRKLIDDGTSILFVSHDISTVRSICSRALWLKSGKTELWGDAMAVARGYEKFCWQEQGVVLQPSEVIDETPTKDYRASLVDKCEANISTSIPPVLFQPNPGFEAAQKRSRMGTGDVLIKNFAFLNEAGDPVGSCDYNERLTFFLLLEVRSVVDSDFNLALVFSDLKGHDVLVTNDLNKFHHMTARPGDCFVAQMNVNIPLHHQDYSIKTGIFGFQDGEANTNGAYDYNNAILWDIVEEATFLKVEPCKIMPLAGPVHISNDMFVEKVD